MRRIVIVTIALALSSGACSRSGEDTSLDTTTTSTTSAVTTQPTSEPSAEPATTAATTSPEVTLATAQTDADAFVAAVYRLLLAELGYLVVDRQEDGLDVSTAYAELAAAGLDVWTGGVYPDDFRHWDEQLPDGSLVGDHVTVVGEQMLAGRVRGFVATRTFTEAFAVDTLDELDDDLDAVAALDAVDSAPGNGVVDILGCPSGSRCADVIDSQIALSGWSNIRQVNAPVDELSADAAARVEAGTPMIAFLSSPGPTITALRPGDNVVWLGVDEVLDDSNPLGLEGGMHLDQRPGVATVDDPSACPSASADGICTTGWSTGDIQATVRTAWLEIHDDAATLLELVTIRPIDASIAAARIAAGEAAIGLASEWITAQRVMVDEWLAIAAEAAAPSD